MINNDFIALMPLLIIAATSLLTMLLTAVKRNYLITNLLTALGLLAAFLTLFIISEQIPRTIGQLIIIDGFALFYLGLIFFASFIVVILSYAYFKMSQNIREEFYMLILLATLGAGILVISKHFVSLFLGLEILSVSLYVLIAYLRSREKSLEGGIKYLILSATSSAFLLFGMAIIYAELGTMDFAVIADKLQARGIGLLTLTGFGMMIVGFGFKLAVVPFHMWTPDVYQGAPAPVSAFIATVSKGSMFALLLRFFIQINGYQYTSVMLIFTIIAIASMFIGNLLALRQNNVKRILAYSSIAHLGYLLVAFLAGGNMGTQAATFYLTAYFITILGAFGIVAFLSKENREAEELEEYRGLIWEKPWIGAIFSTMLLSLAGIPLTAGFMGKFYILASGANSHQWWLIIVLVITSVIGLYYYLRIIVTMLSKPSESSEDRTASLSLTDGIALAALTILLLWMGIYPAVIMNTITSLAGGT